MRPELFASGMREGPFVESALDRLFAPSGRWVRVLYELKPEAIRRGQPNDVAYEAFVKVDACGRKLGFSGIPITYDAMVAAKLANGTIR